MAGQPVQILRVKENHSVEFNESELERILLADNVKDRPVVVISIAGAYRQGKSFLLSFLLRYLKNNGDPTGWKTQMPHSVAFMAPGRHTRDNGHSTLGQSVLGKTVAQ
ncbi:hypothetical protein HPB52_019359 [Rhipicephalus sanguineus]|uniref:GB1/RHD3-type G domain-containing protein n=1 Tax=Rhipicephalus sanguineus TaxID=34632 RepID=A0A9D4PHN2_RHISA|nr:hypothetical protein HPB52_019359 [Rhipicephalus sanguineus]